MRLVVAGLLATAIAAALLSRAKPARRGHSRPFVEPYDAAGLFV